MKPSLFLAILSLVQAHNDIYAVILLDDSQPNGALPLIQQRLMNLARSGSYSGARTTTTSTTRSTYTPTYTSSYSPSYYSYYTPTYYHSYVPSYYSTTRGKATVWSIVGFILVILLIICLVCCCRNTHSDVHVVQTGGVTVTETVTTTRVENGPQARQVPAPYPPAYPGGPTTAWCKSGHGMAWVQGNPYSHEGDDGPVCDSCGVKFDYNLTFAHCYSCEDDLCLNCAPRMVR